MDKIFYVLILLIIIYVAIRIILKIVSDLRRRKRILKEKNKLLSHRTKQISYKKFENIISRFRLKHKRYPDKNEFFKIAIDVSHIVVKRNGFKGHWERQCIRKYLLEKNKVVKEYNMN
jgi:hypothetical protein